MNFLFRIVSLPKFYKLLTIGLQKIYFSQAIFKKLQVWAKQK